VVQKGTELLRTPDAHLRRHPLGEVGRRGDVAGNMAPANRVLEGGVQGAMDVPDGLGGQAAATPPMAAREEPSIEGRQLRWGDPLERKVAETGDDVPLDVPLVAEPSGGPDPWRLHCREPLVHQEPGDGSLGRLDEGAGPKRRKSLVEGLLALLLGPESALAVLAALARNRVRYIEVPGIGAATLADEAPHQGCSSTERPSNSSSRRVGTSRRRPNAMVGSSPLAAAR
jgi:hypothetical protein